jgi:two-component system, OmpR family, phosphate regulon sensor histidine kinase PhoR
MLAADLRRLLLWAAAALALGLLIGRPVELLLLAAVAHVLWLHRQLGRLSAWIRERKQHHAPELPGVFENICREIDFFRDRHKRRRRKLTGYLKQFQAATAALPDATVVLDARGTIQWANAAASQFLGVRWPEDEGQRITNLLRQPELAEALAANISPGTQGQVFEFASPRVEHVQLSMRIVPYGENRRLFVARDVTRLHQLNQVRSDFVANVSHELRTPLTVLMGYIEALITTADQAPPGWGNALDQMHKSSLRMSAMVEDLLLLSRLEDGNSEGAPEVVAVPDLLAQIFRDAQALSGEDRHLISLEVDHSLRLMGRAQELHSAFSNLVVNAVRYTSPRGLIRIAWYADEAGAHLRVTDTGIGIPADHIPRITERFYRVDRSRARSRGGTGLGLAIVKHVLNRHAATLHIESALGQGSTFRCDFPPEALVLEGAAAASVPEAAGEGSGPGEARRPEQPPAGSVAIRPGQRSEDQPMDGRKS